MNTDLETSVSGKGSSYGSEHRERISSPCNSGFNGKFCLRYRLHFIIFASECSEYIRGTRKRQECRMAQPEAHQECNPGMIRNMLPAKLNGTEPADQERNRRYGTQLQPANPERNRQTRTKTDKPGTQTGNPNRHANETNPQPPVRNATERPGTKQANPVCKQETRTGTRTKRIRNRRYGTQLQPADPERNRQPPVRNTTATGRPATATGKPGTERNCNRQTRNGTGAKHD